MSLTSYRAAPPRDEDVHYEWVQPVCRLQGLAASYSSIA